MHVYVYIIIIMAMSTNELSGPSSGLNIDKLYFCYILDM